MKNLSISIMFFLCSFVLSAQSQNPYPVKLRVGTYNVGHFNQGKLGGYQGEDVAEELQRWRNWISEQSLDIFGLVEWNSSFDKDGKIDATKELLSPLYNNIHFGDENRWIYNGIATNYKLENIRQVTLSKDYYAIIGDLKIGDKTVTIMSTHVPWQVEFHEQATNDMIAEMKKYEYLICMGDMNAFDATQLRFQTEGFNIANGGYQGWLVTAPQNKASGRPDGHHIDNIITSKNIKIMNVKAPDAGLSSLDHLPVIADLIFTW